MLHVDFPENSRAITASKLFELLGELEKPLDKLIIEVNRVGGLNVFEPKNGDEMEWIATVDMAFEALDSRQGEVVYIPEGWKRQLGQPT